jgi:hypothetical protein
MCSAVAIYFVTFVLGPKSPDPLVICVLTWPNWVIMDDANRVKPACVISRPLGGGPAGVLTFQKQNAWIAVFSARGNRIGPESSLNHLSSVTVSTNGVALTRNDAG